MPVNTPPPELEAVGSFVRTKRTADDSAGWLVADCSTSPHGADYARVFAKSFELLALLIELTDIEGPLPGTQEWHGKATDLIAEATGA